MSRLVLMVVLAVAIVPACGGDDTRRVVWDQDSIDLGQRHRRTTWTGDVAWRIAGAGPVEILGAKVSCGCVETAVRVDDNPLVPGPYPAGTAGVVELKVRADPRKHTIDEVVPLEWREAGSHESKFAVLRIRGEIVDAFMVEPSALHWDGVDAAAPPKFSVCWTALEPVSGTPRVELEGDGVQLGPLEVGEDAEGRAVLTVAGEVVLPRIGHEARATVRLAGVEPPAPPVGLHAAFRRTLQVQPKRVLELVSAGRGVLQGTVALTAASPREAMALAPVRLVVRPSELEPTFALAMSPVADDRQVVTVSSASAACAGRAGVLTLHHGLKSEPPVELVWYAKATTPPDHSVPSDRKE